MSEEEDWVENIIEREVKAGKSNISILQKLDESPFDYDTGRATRSIRQWREIREGNN